MKIEDTKWAKNFLKECPTQYTEALEYAKNPSMRVDISHNNELYIKDWQYSIVVEDTDFWLDAFSTEKEALDLIEEMGWNIVDAD